MKEKMYLRSCGLRDICKMTKILTTTAKAATATKVPPKAKTLKGLASREVSSKVATPKKAEQTSHTKTPIEAPPQSVPPLSVPPQSVPPQSTPPKALTDEVLKIVITGHVDHGKSTLVGRLFYETNSVPKGKFEEIQATCKKRGMPFEWAFLTDALQAERSQGVTIDTTQIWFSTARRRYVLVDAPGHREFIRNMVTGAASCDAALLLVDAKEGVKQQTRRHAYLLSLLGIQNVAVLVNKMDAVDYSQQRFEEVRGEITSFLAQIGITPRHILPISAGAGDNIRQPSSRMKWWADATSKVGGKATGDGGNPDANGGNTDADGGNPDADGDTNAATNGDANANPPKATDVVAVLDDFSPNPSRNQLPLRLPIQDIYKFDDRRIIAGRIESGTIKRGDELRFFPGNRIGKVKTIESGNGKFAVAGENVGITLTEQIFTERGDIASTAAEPPTQTNTIKAKLFWLAKKPLQEGDRYALRFATTQTEAIVEKVENIINPDTLEAELSLANPNGDTGGNTSGDGGNSEGTAEGNGNTSGKGNPEGNGNTGGKGEAGGPASPKLKPTKVGHNQVGEVVLRTVRTLAVDEHSTNPHNSRFVLFSNYQVAGGGIISLEGYPKHKLAPATQQNIFEVAHKVTTLTRSVRNAHRSGILWLTGLSASGKSTIALETERHLFLKGYQVYALDGDNLRKGLNADLGFSPDHRAENIRRIAQVAGLFAEAGNVVIVSCISPYRDDRRLARQVLPESFFEVYVSASLAECAKRDPKGLYKKAKAGEVKMFSGISAPYEVPQNPHLTLDTEKLTAQEAAARLVDFAAAKFGSKK